VAEGAQDAHSLELQTLAELGVVGAALLLTVLAGITRAAARSVRSATTRAATATTAATAATAATAGPIAALVTYLAHSPLDWDWQMPAVTLIATALAGAVIAAAAPTTADGDAQSASAMRGASRRKIHTPNTHTAA
jgi:O-antigen ligase